MQEFVSISAVASNNCLRAQEELGHPKPGAFLSKSLSGELVNTLIDLAHQ